MSGHRAHRGHRAHGVRPADRAGRTRAYTAPLAVPRVPSRSGEVAS